MSERQRQRRRRESEARRAAGLPADDVQDAGLGDLTDSVAGDVDPNGPLGQALPDVTEAHLAEAGAIMPPDGPRPPVAQSGRDPSMPEEHEVEHGRSRKGLFGRAADFLRASVNELRRVQWPDRRQVGQGTAVVLGFVLVAGLYLGILDAIWNPVIKAIL
jgi:preprotein translocase SecE subunit